MKSIMRLGCLLWLAGSWCGITSAQSELSYRPLTDHSAFVESLTIATQQVKTLTCGFHQEKKLSFMTETMVSEGQLYIKGDNKLRWQYTSPYSYEILLVDNHITIVDGGEANELNVQSNPAFNKMQTLMSTMLRGTFFDQEDEFDISYEENEDFYHVILMPTDPTLIKFIDKLHLYFSKSTLILKEFVLDEQGDYTKTTFSDCVQNEPVDDQVFK